MAVASAIAGPGQQQTSINGLNSGGPLGGGGGPQGLQAIMGPLMMGIQIGMQLAQQMQGGQQGQNPLGQGGMNPLGGGQRCCCGRGGAGNGAFAAARAFA